MPASASAGDAQSAAVEVTAFVHRARAFGHEPAEIRLHASCGKRSLFATSPARLAHDRAGCPSALPRRPSAAQRSGSSARIRAISAPSSAGCRFAGGPARSPRWPRRSWVHLGRAPADDAAHAVRDQHRRSDLVSVAATASRQSASTAPQTAPPPGTRRGRPIHDVRITPVCGGVRCQPLAVGVST